MSQGLLAQHVFTRARGSQGNLGVPIWRRGHNDNIHIVTSNGCRGISGGLSMEPHSYSFCSILRQVGHGGKLKARGFGYSLSAELAYIPSANECDPEG